MEPNALNRLQAEYLMEMKENFTNLKALTFHDDEIEDTLNNGYIVGEVGILEIHGTISQFSDMFMMFFGGVGLDKLTEDFNSLEKNPNVSTTVLSIQSGGGSIFGLQRFTELVRNSKNVTITITDNVMASAAFYIGSAADKIFVTDDMTHVGSVGVLIEHFDTTGLETLTGVKKIPITAGSVKKADASSQPLDPKEKVYLQQRANDLHEIFMNDVALNLNMSLEDVRETFGSGKIFLGKEAIEEGFVDGKSSLNKIIADINESIVEVKEDILNIDFNDLDDFFGDDINMKLVDMKLDDLKNGNKDLYDEILAAGVASVKVEEKKEESKVTTEKTSQVGMSIDDVNKAVGVAMAAHIGRIDDIDALCVVGHDDLVAAAKKDPKMTAGDLAISVVKAGASANAKKKADMNTDIETGVNGVDNEPTKTALKTKGDFSVIMSEEDYNKSEMRTDFRSYANYTSYCKNVGNVKVLSGSKTE